MFARTTGDAMLTRPQASLDIHSLLAFQENPQPSTISRRIAYTNADKDLTHLSQIRSHDQPSVFRKPTNLPSTPHLTPPNVQVPATRRLPPSLYPVYINPGTAVDIIETRVGAKWCGGPSKPFPFRRSVPV